MLTDNILQTNNSTLNRETPRTHLSSQLGYYTLPIGGRSLLRTWIIALCLFSLGLSTARAQVARRHVAFEEYIRKHYQEAIRQMNRHQIPASITMAQGLVETGAGRSSLAKDFNNHFGIKCHSTWKGKRTYKTDDAPNECFRHYNSWQESYEDHSLFLKGRRYARLFMLRSDDYKGWAKGLQTAGYATNKGYANKLIQVIETYELYALDDGQLPLWLKPKHKRERPKSGAKSKIQRPMRQIYMSYGLYYVLADPDDSLERIAEDMGVSVRKLARYNDAPEDISLQEGDVIYLERKNRQATEAYPLHRVAIGDSMYSIAQRYGMRLDRLYTLNNKDEDYIPTEGEILRLR